MAGLEAEVALTLLSSTADDFDVDALLNLQHSDSYIKLLPNNNNSNSSLGNSSKINLTNDNNAVAPSTVSPKSKNGTKGKGKPMKN